MYEQCHSTEEQSDQDHATMSLKNNRPGPHHHVTVIQRIIRSIKSNKKLHGLSGTSTFQSIRSDPEQTFVETFGIQWCNTVVLPWEITRAANSAAFTAAEAGTRFRFSLHPLGMQGKFDMGDSEYEQHLRNHTIQCILHINMHKSTVNNTRRNYFVIRLLERTNDDSKCILNTTYNWNNVQYKH